MGVFPCCRDGWVYVTAGLPDQRPCSFCAEGRNQMLWLAAWRRILTMLAAER
jgi:hypothetical protein